MLYLVIANKSEHLYNWVEDVFKYHKTCWKFGSAYFIKSDLPLEEFDKLIESHLDGHPYFIIEINETSKIGGKLWNTYCKLIKTERL